MTDTSMCTLTIQVTLPHFLLGTWPQEFFHIDLVQSKVRLTSQLPAMIVMTPMSSPSDSSWLRRTQLCWRSYYLRN